MTFASLWLAQKFLDALETQWYTHPTPIQAQAIPLILSGRDVFGCAQTGTGKTAAFALPTLQLLDAQPKRKSHTPIRALILTPTRELAIQIGESFTDYGKGSYITNGVIYGGVTQHSQVKMLSRWVDVLIATPGRLLDLINQKFVNLTEVQFFILDEADRMLDMWFINDVKKVISRLPIAKQTLLFSATMAPSIMNLANGLLKNPAHISVTPVSSTVDTINQSLYTVSKENKKDLLVHLLKNTDIKNAVVFTKTKHGANKVEKILAQNNISSAAIHGNKSQAARQKALANLKDWSIRVLVATDIAARGIDIDELSHVIIHDVPLEPESYVHRIGRTGRAGLKGHAIMFCEPDEMKYLKQVTKLIHRDIPLVKDHPYHLDLGHTGKIQPPAPKGRGIPSPHRSRPSGERHPQSRSGNKSNWGSKR